MNKRYVRICEELKRLVSDIQYAGESGNEESVYLKLKQIKSTVDTALVGIEDELDFLKILNFEFEIKDVAETLLAQCEIFNCSTERAWIEYMHPIITEKYTLEQVKKYI